MESSTMEELFASFEDKISNACSKLALLRYYETEHCEMIYTTKIIASIQGMLYQIREAILLQDQDLEIQMKRIADLEQLVSQHMDHIEQQDETLHLHLKGKPEPSKTVPPSKVGAENRLRSVKTPTRPGTRTPRAKTPIRSDPRTPSAKTPTSNPNQTAKTPTYRARNQENTLPNNRQIAQKKAPANTKSTSRPLEGRPNNNTDTNTNNKLDNEQPAKAFPVLEPVSQGEFNQIPSYMVGRITLDTINQFVESFNMTINKKYKFITEFKSYNSNESDHKKYQAYKALEFNDTRNQYFCTTNDLKEFVASKNVSTMPKILICLRHCKRLKEIRGGQDARTVRYAIITN